MSVGRRALFAWAIAVIFGTAAATFSFAAELASPLLVQNAWLRKAPGAETAAAYLVLRNTSAQPVVITGASSPIASHVMIHESTMVGGQSRMRMHEQLMIAPGQTVTFAPGGLHVMLSGFTKDPVVGQNVPLVLLLANGGQIAVTAVVRPLDAQ